MAVREAIALELHRQAQRNFTRRKVVLKGLNDLYQADLVEMIPYSRVNKGYKYILTMLNCFSKVAFAVPLKSKSAAEVAQALEPIVSKFKFKNFQTDQGKEFFNSHVKALMEKYTINHYATFSDLKSSIVERFNRTLKGKMWRMFTVRGNYEWLSLLPELIREYNDSYHRTIGMKPKDVRQKHVNEILIRMNEKIKPVKPKFSVNDKVRISKYKRVFQKGYLPNWTNEVFTVVLVKHTNPITYILQDSKGEILKGGFYEQELSKSKTGDVYLVEKVLRKKGNKVLVRWAGFDKTSDSWIDKKNIV